MPTSQKPPIAANKYGASYHALARARVVGLSMRELARKSGVSYLRIANGSMLKPDELAAIIDVVEKLEKVEPTFPVHRHDERMD